MTFNEPDAGPQPTPTSPQQPEPSYAPQQAPANSQPETSVYGQQQPPVYGHEQPPVYGQPQGGGYGQQQAPPFNQPQGPVYGQPQGPDYGQPQGPPPKQGRNVVAIVALITAIVGFIFACMPGALIVGWVLLPIAFVLSLVSLFLKGKGKGLGIAGLIISVIGTVVGFVVFFAVVGSSFDEAFSSGDTTAVEPAESGEEADEKPAEEAPAEDSGAADGSRENPVDIGSTIKNDDWTVVINSYTADGNSIVTANEFNDPAPAGSHYEIVNYTVTYTGEDSSYALEVGLDMVTSGGNVVNSYDNLVILDDNMGIDELFNGASITGSAAYLVPDGETVLLRVRPGMLADELFVKP